ncbi:MAG: hypothetical protein ACJA1I_001113 [Zhongshania marina]|jgi:hypothetical protein
MINNMMLGGEVAAIRALNKTRKFEASYFWRISILKGQ